MQIKGVEWQIVDGVRQKFIIRLNPATKRVVREAVVWVDAAEPFCGICLSADQIYEHDHATWRCSTCGLRAEAPSVTN